MYEKMVDRWKASAGATGATEGIDLPLMKAIPQVICFRATQ